MGTPHAMEITYKFYNVPQPGQQIGNVSGGLMSISRPESVKGAHNMAEMWSTFARTGKPSADSQPEWPAYPAQSRATMEIDVDCRIVNDQHPLERILWERLDP
jgi:para-nitrobenzyl esterase